MSAVLYNDWYVSPTWSDVGPSYGSYSNEQKHNVDKIYTILKEKQRKRGYLSTNKRSFLFFIKVIHNSSLLPLCIFSYFANKKSPTAPFRKRLFCFVFLITLTG